MIREILESEKNIVFDLAKRDVIRNYFILLGLLNKKTVYEKIYGEFMSGELKAILLKRKSGTLQFYSPTDFDLDGFGEIILNLNAHSMIGAKSYCSKFLERGIFSSSRDGAYMAKLEKKHIKNRFENKYKIREIRVNDLEKVVDLYKSVFPSFAPKEVMEEKLKTKRGRGVLIEEDGEIISVCQTDFETSDSVVIVGVATKKSHRNKGLATFCLKVIIETLANEGKDIYLQYDNLEAGQIYKELGFKVIDQIVHLKRGDK